MLCAGNCQYMWRIYKTGELFCSGRIFVNCLFQFPLETSWNGNQVRLNQMNDPKVTAGECQVHKLTLITQEFMCILHFACLKEETKKGNNDDFFLTCLHLTMNNMTGLWRFFTIKTHLSL